MSVVINHTRSSPVVSSSGRFPGNIPADFPEDRLVNTDFVTGSNCDAEVHAAFELCK